MFDEFVPSPADSSSAPAGVLFGPDGRVPLVLRPCEVAERAALSLTHVYRLIGEGSFPPFTRLGLRARGLAEPVLDAFFAARMAAREGLPPLGFRPPLPRWRLDAAPAPARSGIRLMRRRDVLACAGVSKSTLDRLVGQERFPAPVPLGPCATRWVAHEVAAVLGALGA